MFLNKEGEGVLSQAVLTGRRLCGYQISALACASWESSL